jgi:hypothetical protein
MDRWCRCQYHPESNASREVSEGIGTTAMRSLARKNRRGQAASPVILRSAAALRGQVNVTDLAPSSNPPASTKACH